MYWSCVNTVYNNIIFGFKIVYLKALNIDSIDKYTGLETVPSKQYFKLKHSVSA